MVSLSNTLKAEKKIRVVTDLVTENERVPEQYTGLSRFPHPHMGW